MRHSGDYYSLHSKLLSTQNNKISYVCNLLLVLPSQFHTHFFCFALIYVYMWKLIMKLLATAIKLS